MMSQSYQVFAFYASFHLSLEQFKFPDNILECLFIQKKIFPGKIRLLCDKLMIFQASEAFRRPKYTTPAR